MITKTMLILSFFVTMAATPALRAQGWGERDGREKRGYNRGRKEPVRHEGKREVRHEEHRAVERPLAHHAEIMRNAAFLGSVRGHERDEMVRGRYYWHADHGIRYAHFYDPRGIHWYGYYWGPRFYWTRYWGNRWWWFDVPLHRWVYWWNGYWWWTGPGGVAYYYYGDNFVPYQPAVVVRPAAPAPTAPRPTVDSTSPDGSRLIQIMGPRSEAFLYDRTTGENVYVNYLGPNVESVRYAGGGNTGKPLQILVNFKDGSFGVFDGNGRSTQGGPFTAAKTPAQAATAAPAAGAAKPEMPTSAPPPLDVAPPSPDDQPPSAPPAGSDQQPPANQPAAGPGSTGTTTTPQ